MKKQFIETLFQKTKAQIFNLHADTLPGLIQSKTDKYSVIDRTGIETTGLELKQ